MNSIIFVSELFQINKTLTDLILHNIPININSIYFMDENNKNNIINISKVIENSQKTLIITTKQTYASMSKLLATITGDILIAKDNNLICSKATLYSDNSYIIEFEDREINILKIDEKIPEILISKDEIYNLTLNIFDIDEDSINIFLKTIMETFNLNYKLYPSLGGWTIANVKVKNYSEALIHHIHSVLPGKVLITNNIIKHIQTSLKRVNKKITFAESCTGGLLSSLFTKLSGASKILDGSVITYSNEIKNNWLGVDTDTLNNYGAVSEQTIKEMLDGVINISKANYAIAISGIAGPTGGTKEKPVGTVFIGVKYNDIYLIERLTLKGNREEIQYKSVYHSLRLLVNINKEDFFNFL